MEQRGFGVRLRLHASVHLNDEAGERALSIGGSTVNVRVPREPELLNPTRIVLNVRGFPDEESATAYGKRLKAAVAVAAALQGFGIDLGDGQAGSLLDEALKGQIKAEKNITLREDLHGLDVFHDDGTVRHLEVSPQEAGASPPAALLAPVGQAFRWVQDLPKPLIEVAQLLNAADYAGVPGARIVLSLFAIEMMAPQLGWSYGARTLLNDLILAVNSSASVDDEESTQLAQSLAKLQEYGPLSNVRVWALLKDLGMTGHWRSLTGIYDARSNLLRGNFVDKQQLEEASVTARQVAQDVLIAALKQQGADVASLLRAKAGG
ncbi:MAG: hypothetical protein ACFCUQ_05885 [Kiloniellales bacterium]